MFFMGFGLYFTKTTPSLLLWGAITLSADLVVRLAASYAVSKRLG
ncbi:hypothetical protein PQ610_07090 [Tardisphaera miroshnichenkoae]